MKLRLALLLAFTAVVLRASPELDSAVALYREKKFPDARAALEKIATAEPANAAACYWLGLTLSHRGDATALDDAVPWLQKAVDLAPNNADYLADFGGISMQFAQKNSSLAAALKGRDAMEKSLTINPDNLDTREGLFRFYDGAPWPIGSGSKAAKQLEEIRKRDADRATVLSVIGKTNAKDFAAAFKLCDEALAKNPANYVALYQYGRTASVSGQNVERGIACLEKCLALAPPGPASPTHSNASFRLGSLHEHLKHPAEARAAYESALQLDPANKQAAGALAKLK